MNFNEMVDNIKRAYSEERLESSKRRLIDVWDLKIPKDRTPFVFSKIPDDSGVNENRLLENGYSYEEQLYYQLLQWLAVFWS